MVAIECMYAGNEENEQRSWLYMSPDGQRMND